jgi:hypothetical protein
MVPLYLWRSHLVHRGSHRKLFPTALATPTLPPGAHTGNCVDPRANYEVTVARYGETLLPCKKGEGPS